MIVALLASGRVNAAPACLVALVCALPAIWLSAPGDLPLSVTRSVGRWTVEKLPIFTLGRPDVLPVDDFGVREGWRLIQTLADQPRAKMVAALGEAWAPHRSTAAWYLWHAADQTKKVKPLPVS